MRLLRYDDWTSPVRPVRREVLSAPSDSTEPPVLFVAGPGVGARAYAEHWLGHTAGRGFPAHALSAREESRGNGRRKSGLREYAHDVVQTAAQLPKQTILIGHGVGALIVARALGRYPARAAVLVSPVMDRWRVPAPLRGRFEATGLEKPVGDPPVLVVGSPDDRMVPRRSLDRTAARYGGAPLLFPGMGHDLLTGDGWAEPIDAIIDWLRKELAA